MTRPPTAPFSADPSRRQPDRVPRSAARVVLLVGAVLALASSPAIALAQGEPQLRGSVTDQADVLTPAQETEVADGLARLRDAHGIQLFAAYVDTTGSATVTDFASSTAERNSLGGNDALLLVAIDDRSDALWVGPSLDGVTNDEIDAILVDAVEPNLQKGDFVGCRRRRRRRARRRGGAGRRHARPGDRPARGRRRGGRARVGPPRT